MRLINADELLEELKKSCEWHAENSRELSLLQRDINIVKEQPTVDAVPVIRCNDCGNWDCGANDIEQWGYCKTLKRTVDPTDWCSWAERVEE